MGRPAIEGSILQEVKYDEKKSTNPNSKSLVK